MAPRKPINRLRHRTAPKAPTQATIPTHATKVTKRTSKHATLLTSLATSSNPQLAQFSQSAPKPSTAPESAAPKQPAQTDTSRGKIPKIPSQYSKSSLRRLKRKSKAQLAGKNMADLASALEDVLGGAQASEGHDASSKDVETKGTSDPRSRRIAEMKKSLKTQPGAQKKKERISAMERERFKGNVGTMMGEGDRWGALRAQIQGAMENKQR